MTIEVTEEQSGGRKVFFADCKDLPGSPPCGTGYTEAEAVATLFIRNMETFRRVDMSILKVNGKLYQHPGQPR